MPTLLPNRAARSSRRSLPATLPSVRATDFPRLQEIPYLRSPHLRKRRARPCTTPSHRLLCTLRTPRVLLPTSAPLPLPRPSRPALWLAAPTRAASSSLPQPPCSSPPRRIRRSRATPSRRRASPSMSPRTTSRASRAPRRPSRCRTRVRSMHMATSTSLSNAHALSSSKGERRLRDWSARGGNARQGTRLRVLRGGNRRSARRLTQKRRLKGTLKRNRSRGERPRRSTANRPRRSWSANGPQRKSGLLPSRKRRGCGRSKRSDSASRRRRRFSDGKRRCGGPRRSDCFTSSVSPKSVGWRRRPSECGLRRRSGRDVRRRRCGCLSSDSAPRSSCGNRRRHDCRRRSACVPLRSARAGWSRGETLARSCWTARSTSRAAGPCSGVDATSA
ncbi:hypothetical protein DMC30DRAFT_287824 [Rhodotorula diobovata]|uniref:Uncharacterized protein n=1 Tax=Rhodotorula diobovata TaxID=5288 RepID=A0A5C5FU67_9BASI|nr:hypothetical protein DMC30DRAFT_287824 [Rhodotorula diobovata]